jgi:hypothetical protein
MEEGSDTVRVPTSSEDEGFEHVSVPRNDDTEGDATAFSPMSSPTELPESAAQEEPTNEPEVPSPPPRVEDVPKKELEVPSSKEDKPKPRDGHPRGYMSFLEVFSDDILDIIYWRNIQYSAGALLAVLAFLLTVTINPLVHSITLALLAAFIVTLTYSAGKVAWDSFHNEPLANPFQGYLDKGFKVPEELFTSYAKLLAKEVNCTISMITRLIFFADVFTSLKFLVVLYIASYFTPYLTLLTALYIGTILLFSVPKVYELYQSLIDANINLVATQVRFAWNKVASMIPFLPKKKVE